MFSCPADDCDPMDAPADGGEGEPTILRALGSGKLLIQGSLSFKRERQLDDHSGSPQLETEISIRAGDIAAAEAEAPPLVPRELARLRGADGSSGAESPGHEAAALRLQKVYKSFRTQRQLADCWTLRSSTAAPSSSSTSRSRRRRCPSGQGPDPELPSSRTIELRLGTEGLSRSGADHV